VLQRGDEHAASAGQVAAPAARRREGYARVKNTLSTVQSIALQALRMSSHPSVVRESTQSRLFALSRSHDLLTRVEWPAIRLS
jgi:two-component sensor histidine kinase